VNKFKIARICHFHLHLLLDEFYLKNNLKSAGYSQVQNAILEESFYGCGALTSAFSKSGHECHEIIWDIDWLQKKWAKENNFQYDRDNWRQDIVLAQLKKIEPEVVLFQHNSPLSIAQMYKLKSKCPSIKLLVVHTAYLGQTPDFGWADLVLAGTPGLVSRFEKKGYKSKLFYHYFDERLLGKFDQIEKDNKLISFCGTSGFGYGTIHVERYFLLEKLLLQTPIKMWLNEPINSNWNISRYEIRRWLLNLAARFPEVSKRFSSTFFPLPQKMRKFFSEVLDKQKNFTDKTTVPKIPLIQKFPTKVLPGLVGTEYYSAILKSAACFHKHGISNNNPSIDNCGDIGAMRLFEVTGLGACLITDTGTNMADLFQEGEEVVTYGSPDEAVDKINYLADNPETCKRIGLAGQKRTMSDHTAAKRSEQLLGFVSEVL
jgi:spore maturation protein CgeB